MSGYLKIDGIDGESVDKKHDKWINLESVSQALSRPMPMGATGSQRNNSSVSVGEVNITKEGDKSTPKLIEAVCLGKVFKDVKIDLTQSIGNDSRVPYLQWELKNVIVSSYNVGSTPSTGQPPVETISLNFEEAKWIYTQYGKDGSSKGKVETTWKVEEGTK